MADIITPNIPEAKILLGPLYHSADHQQNVKQLLKLGARAVLLKGGHDQGAQSNDVFMDREGNFELLEARRIDTKNNHGTGCTLASAIACGLAKGLPPLEACRAAKAYITRALGASDQLAVGQGHGPVHHFHSLWK